MSLNAEMYFKLRPTLSWAPSSSLGITVGKVDFVVILNNMSLNVIPVVSTFFPHKEVSQTHHKLQKKHIMKKFTLTLFAY